MNSEKNTQLQQDQEIEHQVVQSSVTEETHKSNSTQEETAHQEIIANQCELHEESKEKQEDTENDNLDKGEKETHEEPKERDNGQDKGNHYSDQRHDEEERFKIKIYDDSSMRKQISFAIYALKEGKTIQISAFGQNSEKAVRMAEILKLRIGMLHQDTSIFTRKPSPRERDRGEDRDKTGVVIKLSKETLDKNSVGYQKPKPIDETLVPNRGGRDRQQFRGSFRNRERLERPYSHERILSGGRLDSRGAGERRFSGRSPQQREFVSGFAMRNQLRFGEQRRPFDRQPFRGGPPRTSGFFQKENRGGLDNPRFGGMKREGGNFYDRHQGMQSSQSGRFPFRNNENFNSGNRNGQSFNNNFFGGKGTERRPFLDDRNKTFGSSTHNPSNYSMTNSGPRRGGMMIFGGSGPSMRGGRPLRV